MSKPDAIVRQLVTGSLVSVLVSVLIGLLNYLTRRTLALNLPETSYGFFYSAFSFVMLFLAYLDLGLNSSGTILIARHDTHGQHEKARAVFSIIFFLKLAGGLAIGGILLAFAPLLSRHYFSHPDGLYGLMVLCAFIPANALCGTVVSTLDAYRQFLARNLFQAAKFGLIFLAVISFATRAPNTGPAVAYAAGATIMFVVGLLFLRWKHGLAIRLPSGQNVSQTWHETWHFGKWVAISTAGMTTMFYMDTLMLTCLQGLKSVALYNVALPVMQIMQSVMILPLIFMPIATQLWQHKHREELGGLITVVMEISILFLCFVAIGMACLRELIIRLLFAEKFLAAGNALVILCAAMAVLVLGHFLINTLNAMERQKDVARIVIIGAGVNIAANLVLIPWLDIEGAAAATLVSYLVIAFLGHRTMKSALDLKFRFLPLLPACIASIAILACLVAFRWEMSTTQAVTTCAAALGLLTVVCAVFNHDLVRRVLQYVKR